MKLDELAFANQQLASMIKSGIPLEGALKELCDAMQRGKLRDELQKLQADLEAGLPLQEALEARALPAFYVAMLKVGVHANDLTSVLVLLADYYQRLHLVGTRLKGLMVYPAIVLALALILSAVMTRLYCAVVIDLYPELTHQPAPDSMIVVMWLPAVFFALTALGAILVAGLKPLRRWLRWRLPAFREASLSHLAAAMALLLKGGSTLPDALRLVREMEGSSAAGAELAQWQQRLAEGHSSLGAIIAPGKCFPRTFLWLISNPREDAATGFARAAQIYHARALHRVDMMLHGALPVTVLFLGTVLMFQLIGTLRPMIELIPKLGGY